METLRERDADRRLALEKKRHRRVRQITVIASLLVLFSVSGFILYTYINRSFNSYIIKSQVPREDSNTVHYERYGTGNILKYSRDGASGLTSRGEVLWNGSYELKNPAAFQCGNYVLIADIGGKEAYVYDGKDSGRKIETVLPIIDGDVAGQGVAVLMLEDSGYNKFCIYDPYSTDEPLKVEKATNTDTDGFPVDIAVSNDGKKLVTSYLYINNGAVESRLSFYNFGAVGKTSINNLVKAEKFSQAVIPKVDFLNNNTICVYGENGFNLYHMDEKPEQIKEAVAFEYPIKSTFSNGGYFGFILEKFEGDFKYQAIVYSLSGKELLKKDINYDYDTVFLSGKELVFYTDLKCAILRLNGKEKFAASFEQGISLLLPVNNYDKYILIDDKEIKEIELTEEKKK